MNILEALCVLVVAFLCPDVEAGPIITSKITVKLTYGYPIRDWEVKRFKVKCASNCQIHDIRVEKFKGKLILRAYTTTHYDNICNTRNKPCSPKNISGKEFLIDLDRNPEFSGGNLIVELGQTATLTEVNAEGAMRLSKNLIRMKSGYKELNEDFVTKKYKIQCNGKCTKLKFYANKDIIVAASKEPVFKTEDGCLNCFCVWKQNQKVNPNCISGNLSSSAFYVNLIHYKKFEDATAYVVGDFKSIDVYDDDDMAESPYDYENGYKAVASPVLGPTVKDHNATFKVYCKDKKTCTGIKIEIPTYSTLYVKTVRAGKDTSLDDKGQCKNCDCTDRTSCLKRFNPSLVDNNDYLDYFTIDLTVGASNRTYPAYVRVSGKGIDSIDEDDYYYYYY